MRLEHDGLGQMELPEEAYWGIVSERNRKAFDVGPLTLDNYPSYIRAIALCKIACARANAEIGALDPKKPCVSRYQPAQACPWYTSPRPTSQAR